MKTILKIISEVTGEIFELWYKKRQIRSKIACLERNKPQTDYDNPGYPLLTIDRLLAYLQQENERRQILEDKAKTNILGITLAFSAILASVALVPRITEAAEHSPGWIIWVFWVFIGLQVFGIIFLLLGGWLALHTLRVSKFYTWTLDDERSITTDEARNTAIKWYLQINQLVHVLKANNLSASYTCIRNGVTALAIAAMLALMIVAAATAG